MTPPRPPRTRWRGPAADPNRSKHILANLLGHPHEGIAFNEHYTGDGAIIYKHACALGCESIVSKRLAPYRSGRTDCWVKVKNPTGREPPRRRRLEEVSPRRFPPLWSVDEEEACVTVLDATGPLRLFRG
jgi:hypothetical protein